MVLTFVYHAKPKKLNISNNDGGGIIFLIQFWKKHNIYIYIHYIHYILEYVRTATYIECTFVRDCKFFDF